MGNRNLQKFSFYIGLIGSLCSIISLICPDFKITSFIIKYFPYISLFCCVLYYVTYNFFIPKHKEDKQDIPTEEARPSYIPSVLLALIFVINLFIIFSLEPSYAGNDGEYANDYFKLQKLYDDLQKSYNDLEKSYDDLQKLHDDLEKSYDKLQQFHVGLQQSYDSITNTCAELLKSDNELKNSYNDLQQLYNELEDKYTTLMEENSLLEGTFSGKVGFRGVQD